MRRGIFVTAALSCFATASFGQVTGLVSIPTADVIGHREIELGYSLAGMELMFLAGFLIDLKRRERPTFWEVRLGASNLCRIAVPMTRLQSALAHKISMVDRATCL